MPDESLDRRVRKHVLQVVKAPCVSRVLRIFRSRHRSLVRIFRPFSDIRNLPDKVGRVVRQQEHLLQFLQFQVSGVDVDREAVAPSASSSGLEYLSQHVTHFLPEALAQEQWGSVQFSSSRERALHYPAVGVHYRLLLAPRIAGRESHPRLLHVRHLELESECPVVNVQSHRLGSMISVSSFGLSSSTPNSVISSPVSLVIHSANRCLWQKSPGFS